MNQQTDTAHDDPFKLFGLWMKEAELAEPDNPNAMILASADARGQPGARAVLCKHWDERGFVFYTNLESRKAREIRENPKVSLLFYWKSLARQVRIDGIAEQIPDDEADAYFATRPRGSQLGAWASRQSAEMPNGKADFEQRLHEVEERFHGREVPRPPFWSGFRVTPRAIEFWEEQPFRWHDRRLFHRNDEGAWTMSWLYP
ncbi:MAG: pyridoxamine 5'-phosphate oxidase [Alphaproteobacteria bacterium]|nr:MAG: pyridoxamine 5'-phosphate oxidase [Alphaproteobacteria bacterium]